MRIGDNVICKKCLEHEVNLIVGKSYKISEIYLNGIICIIGDRGRLFEFLTGNDNGLKEYYLEFNDYFYTEKKVRKLKLDKIDERGL